ncbi:MAG: tripartite tricarboxylate transporter TctB family protein [candidate division NC10 bacterium]|nr:tripartite tricarboxylate transporter TctB family protein [candidate division NC10 bacterium]
MPPVSMKKVDIVSALCVIPICIYVFYESGQWPILPDLGNPAWIPRGVAAILFGAALLLLGKALKGGSLTLPGRLEGADRSRVLWVAVLTGVYLCVIERLGFMTTTAPYLFGFSLVLGERRWVRLILFALVVPVATYLLFDTALNVPLPRGLFR